MSIRTFRAALVAAALPLGLLTFAPAAEAGLTQSTTLTGTPASTVGMYHDNVDQALPPLPDTVTYEADLVNTGSTAISGATVTLERQFAGRAWKTVATTTTDSTGHASTVTDVAGSASYRWVYAGDPSHAAAMSDVMTLKAQRDFNTNAAELPGRKVKLYGNINPGWGNSTVKLYKRVNSGKWRKVDAMQSSRSGGWHFAVGYPGTVGPDWYFRAVIGSGGLFVASKSQVLHTYTVPARGAATHGRAIL